VLSCDIPDFGLACTLPKETGNEAITIHAGMHGGDKVGHWNAGPAMSQFRTFGHFRQRYGLRRITSVYLKSWNGRSWHKADSSLSREMSPLPGVERTIWTIATIATDLVHEHWRTGHEDGCSPAYQSGILRQIISLIFFSCSMSRSTASRCG
jgi:hypothetical protein